MVTKEAWLKWRDDPVTKTYIKALFDTRESNKEGIAEGQAEGIMLDRAIGRLQGLKDAINYALYDFEVVDESIEEQDDHAV